MTTRILGTKQTVLTIGYNIFAISENNSEIKLSINGRAFSKEVCENAFAFAIKHELTSIQFLYCVASIFKHPNQINLADFLRHCITGQIRFVFLGDRAGVGAKEQARDVFSFDSLDDMIAFSAEGVSRKDLETHFSSLRDEQRKRRYSNNHSIRSKNGQFISKELVSEQFATQPCVQIGARIHENWAKAFNAHTPPPIPSNYNYYNNLKRGTPEYNGSRQFVKNYVSQNAVSIKEAIAVFNKGVSDFGAQFESLVKTCPDSTFKQETSNKYPPLDKVDRYFSHYQVRYGRGSIPSVREVSKRFKEFKRKKQEWISFLSPRYL